MKTINLKLANIAHFLLFEIIFVGRTLVCPQSDGQARACPKSHSALDSDTFQR